MIGYDQFLQYRDPSVPLPVDKDGTHTEMFEKFMNTYSFVFFDVDRDVYIRGPTFLTPFPQSRVAQTSAKPILDRKGMP